MPKKGKKKGKKSKKGAEQEEEAPTFETPDFEPSWVDVRTIDADIRVVSPVCQLMNFRVQLTPSTIMDDVARLVRKHHHQAVRHVKLCLNRYHPDEILEPKMTLEQLGITTGECVIFYDFVPIVEPLIT